MKASEIKKLLQTGKAVKLIDVREQEEFNQGDAIPGAENMPMGKVFVEAAKGSLPKNQKIITICKSGTRCEIVARELQKKGYDIDYLEGGITGWDKEA